RAAALHVDNDQGRFRHNSPADGFHFEGNARTAGARDGDAACETCAIGHRDCGDFVFALNEGSAVLGQFATEDFHDVGPWSDRVSGTETHAGGNNAVSEGLIAGHDHLLALFALALDEFEGFEDLAERMSVTGMEGSQSVVEDAGIFSSKTFSDEGFQFR